MKKLLLLSLAIYSFGCIFLGVSGLECVGNLTINDLEKIAIWPLDVLEYLYNLII